MPNMSYCRFENTLRDLVDCQEALDDNGIRGVEDDASEHERASVRELIRRCKMIADDYGDAV